MTKNKVEEISERISRHAYIDGHPATYLYEVDPHKLAEVLVEMEERKPKHLEKEKSMIDVNYNKSRRVGYLAALEEVEDKLFYNTYTRGGIEDILDELREKCENSEV